MTNLIKVNDRFLNLDRIRMVQDLAHSRQNQLVVHFGGGENDSVTFSGQDADNLRTWLNSIAQDLTHIDLDNEA